MKRRLSGRKSDPKTPGAGHVERASMGSVASDIELFIRGHDEKTQTHRWSTEGLTSVHRREARSLFLGG